jgi:antitoxin VapB
MIYSIAIYQWRFTLVDTAKLFWSGRSQAVRLPKEYRFEGMEVRIRRQGRAVVLEPVEDEWAWLEKVVGPLDEDFARAALDRPAIPAPDRPGLDEIFK